jgi:high-affinity iron transporter
MSKTKFANHAPKSIKAATRVLRLAALLVSLLVAGTAPALQTRAMRMSRRPGGCSTMSRSIMRGGRRWKGEERAGICGDDRVCRRGRSQTRGAAAGAKAGLLSEAKAFRGMVAQKAAPNDVAKSARTLAAHLLTAYPVPLAPSKTPDLARGNALYAQKCAGCHGLSGDGHGPDAAKQPVPVAFADASRARERSPFALYQVIGQGLDGTAMRSFSELPSQDRWNLAFYIGRFAFPNAGKGEQLWKSDAALRSQVPNLAALAG